MADVILVNFVINRYRSSWLLDFYTKSRGEGRAGISMKNKRGLWGMIKGAVIFLMCLAAAILIFNSLWGSGTRIVKEQFPEECYGQDFNDFYIAIGKSLDEGNKDYAKGLYKQFRQCQDEEKFFRGRILPYEGPITKELIEEWEKEYAEENV